MLLAVECFNSPMLRFKSEVFAVLSQIAWTYLMHEFYSRRNVPITGRNGKTLALSELMKREDFPIRGDAKKNLEALKQIRDDTEHKILSAFGTHFFPLFQANCLNFEQAIKELFGEKLSLGEHLSVAIQFSKMSIDQLAELQKFDVSPAIEAIEKAVSDTVKETGKEGLGYKFNVHFNLETSSRGNAHIKFVNDNSKAVSNVMAQKVASDELWPFKPGDVVQRVRAHRPSFNQHHHRLAWMKHGVRPSGGSQKPDSTNKKYCTYHKAHGDYTYSQAWVDLLSKIASSDEDFAELVEYKAK